MSVEKIKITIEALVNAPIEKVWNSWTESEHITKWNFAHPSWCCPSAINNVSNGGKFSIRMEAVDGSMGFDLEGQYDKVIKNELLDYHLADDRKVIINFVSKDNATHITQTFEAETQNPIEMQRGGWQAILDNFKKYTEEN